MELVNYFYQVRKAVRANCHTALTDAEKGVTSDL